MLDPEINALVHSCYARDPNLDSVLLQRWQKETVRQRNNHHEPVLRCVPVDSFGEHVLVVEDDSLVRETAHGQDHQPGCTLVMPRQEHWVKQFLKLSEDE